MRYLVNFFGAAALILAFAGTAVAQVGYDRRGSDYTSFTVRNGDPAVCASRCEHDVRCHAWSFSYPHTTSSLAACRLKTSLPPRQEDACCVSGVRGAGIIAPRSGGIEYSIDRAGGDYRSFDTPMDATGAACKSACETDNHCRAWTYVRPGYIASSARCYLKSKLTRPRHKPCCISGVVR